MNGTPSPERLERLRTLLSDTLEQEPADRAAFIHAACADDAELRSELVSLLAAHDATGSFDAVATALSTVTRRPAEAELGRRLGPFRIVRVLGYGGMGAVYLGERADGQFEQRVALKIIRSGRGGEEARHRFLEERQILARLEHPHIARLLDGGITEEGEPYFAMEYIEGEPIDDYSDSRRLSVDQRLQLFLQVCDAVQHAHQSLVVHRDLKPSNILVTSAGQVKLLDFGIAKLLPHPDGGGVGITQTRLRWVTPEYAAPELVRAEPVTTAADVYALGVVLYKLLVGRPPYQVTATSAAELERQICETEPARPSDALLHADEKQPTAAEVSAARSTQPLSLRHRLVGDLDTIILQTLRKEPVRRYRSAEQLAEDIRRHLAGLPVRARAATAGYRAAKFVKRHRAALTVALIMVVLLVAGIIGTTTQAIRARSEARSARQERDRARVEASKAERVSTFLASLFEEADPERARPAERTARELLDRGAAWVKDSLASEPEVQATMMHTIGNIYENLGLLEQAEAQLQSAIDLRRRIHTDTTKDHAFNLSDLGMVAQRRGQYPRAESLYRSALTLHRKVTSGDDWGAANTLNNLGLLLQVKGDLEAAQQIYEEALPLTRRVKGNRDPEVARLLNNLGSVKRMRGDFDGAEAPLREALAIKLEVLGHDNASTANTVNQLGVVQQARGNYQDAETLYREALSIRRRLLGDSNWVVGITLMDLGGLYRDDQRYAAADSVLRQAMQIMRVTLGERHANFGFASAMLASVQLARGNLVAAEPLYHQSLATMRAALPATHPQIATTLLGLGTLLLQRGAPVSAEPLLREALSIRRQKLQAGDWKIAEAENTLGAALSALGQGAAGEPLLLHGFDVLTAARGVPELARRRARDFVIAHYHRAGNPTKAASYRTNSASN